MSFSLFVGGSGGGDGASLLVVAAAEAVVTPNVSYCLMLHFVKRCFSFTLQTDISAASFLTPLSVQQQQ